MNLEDKKLELTFPCEWQYRVVGKSKESIEESVKNIFGNKTHKITVSKSSSSGKFISINIDTVINSHDERLALHETLRSAEEILYVL